MGSKKKRSPAAVTAAQVPVTSAKVHQVPVVDDFHGQHAFLGNFFPAKVEVDGLVYANAEAAYQASKCAAPAQRRRFAELTSPTAARRLGAQVTTDADWPARRVDAMARVLRAKFANPDLRDQLLATGNARLVFINAWGDAFWGVCDGAGENHLGRLLEQLRAQLAGDTAGDVQAGDQTGDAQAGDAQAGDQAGDAQVEDGDDADKGVDHHDQ